MEGLKPKVVRESKAPTCMHCAHGGDNHHSILAPTLMVVLIASATVAYSAYAQTNSKKPAPATISNVMLEVREVRAQLNRMESMMKDMNSSLKSWTWEEEVPAPAAEDASGAMRQ